MSLEITSLLNLFQLLQNRTLPHLMIVMSGLIFNLMFAERLIDSSDGNLSNNYLDNYYDNQDFYQIQKCKY